jgi:hypothetical protein
MLPFDDRFGTEPSVPQLVLLPGAPHRKVYSPPTL